MSFNEQNSIVCTLCQWLTPIQAIAGQSKDDRPAESLSYAATNLVKPGLQSRRQQSEPPNNRNVFPPTPPPENDKPSQPSRATSVRNGPKPIPDRLNLDRAKPRERYERERASPGESRRPTRAASANPSRSYSQREPMRSTRSVEEEEDAYPDFYDMYNGNGGSGGGGGGARNSRGKGRGPARYVEEEEGSDYEDASFDEGDFEMVSARKGSVSGGARRSTSKQKGPTRVRVKVHAGDVRYVQVGVAVEFPDLVSSIQSKFGLRRRFKLKVKEEDGDGDMITMGDQDDLDMILATAIENAQRQRSDTAKMEVS